MNIHVKISWRCILKISIVLCMFPKSNKILKCLCLTASLPIHPDVPTTTCSCFEYMQLCACLSRVSKAEKIHILFFHPLCTKDSALIFFFYLMRKWFASKLMWKWLWLIVATIWNRGQEGHRAFVLVMGPLHANSLFWWGYFQGFKK